MRPRRRVEAFSPDVKLESTASVSRAAAGRGSRATLCLLSALSYERRFSSRVGLNGRALTTLTAAGNPRFAGLCEAHPDSFTFIWRIQNMATATGHTSAIRAKRVIGTNVKDTSGRKIGEIEDVVL